MTFTQKTYRKILNAAHVLTSASGAGDASNPAFDMAKWKQQDYAASARWEREQAYQSYRQGERAEAQPVKSELDSAAYQLGLILSPNFTAQEADVIVVAASRLAQQMGGPNVFRQELGTVKVIKDNLMSYGGLADKGKITLNTGTGFDSWRVTHELAHAWDATDF